MKPRRIWLARAAAALAGGVVAIALVGPTLASHVAADPIVGGEAIVGRATNVSVTLRSDGGSPIRYTVVTLYEHASFAGVEGEVEVGHAITDDNGVATFGYQPRSAGRHALRMEYMTNGSEEAESAAVEVEVSAGGQLVHAPAGVDVPGVGVEFVLVLLSIVWSILLWVAFRLIAIARAAGRTEALDVKLTA